MTRKFNNIKKTFIFFLFFLVSKSSLLFGGNWVIAAEKFTFPEKQNTAVNRGLAETIPQKLLDQVLKYSSREIQSDEQNQRKLYELKNQRTSLFLQLSAEIQKRDTLITSTYDQRTYEKKLKESENKINDIKNQIDKNLETQKIILAGNYKEPAADTDFISKKFAKEDDSKLIENISIYKDNSSILYEISDNNKNASKNSAALEKELVSNGINALIWGHINVYSQYITVTVELTSYPGAKTLAVIKDYGNLDEIDSIVYNIVSDLNNAITNSMPSRIEINGIPQSAQIYIDNKLVSTKTNTFILDSGVHQLEFCAEGYKSAGTSYFFEGNQKYDIQVNLEELTPKTIKLKTQMPVIGSFYLNGIHAQAEDEYSVISINGKSALGQFITEDNVNTFFYITEENLKNNNSYTVNAQMFNTGDYIEKRRRWMYTSYSVLVSSLIPVFVCRGQVNSYESANAAGLLTNEKDIKTANNWITASNITTGISVGCGVWFIYELVRYLYSANKVLPVEAKYNVME